MKNQRGYSINALLMTMLFLAAAGGIGWVTLGIVAQDRWPIRWLEVNGSFQRVSAENVRSVLVPMMDSSYFTADLPGLTQAAGNIAWVSEVDVRKHWPDTISVMVHEYKPVAHWNRGQLISSNGIAFEVAGADQQQGLPWLEGPDSRLDDVLEQWVKFDQALLPLGLDIQKLVLNRRGAWSMTLSNGTHVQLGRDDADERLARMVVSWSGLMSDRSEAPKDIDLRYTNGFAVNWPQAESTRNDS